MAFAMKRGGGRSRVPLAFFFFNCFCLKTIPNGPTLIATRLEISYTEDGSFSSRKYFINALCKEKMQVRCVKVLLI